MINVVDRHAGSKGLFRSAEALCAYFSDRFDTQLELIPQAPETLEPSSEKRVIFLGHELETLGLWGIRSQRQLPTSDVEEVLETFRCILTSVHNLNIRRNHAAQIRAHYSTGVGENSSNVIPLRRSIPQASTPYKPDGDKHWILRLDCLIESPHVSEIHKMALELHSQGNRYAFIEYADLSATSRTSLLDLLTLGQVTLFVPNILSLAMDEQIALKRLSHLETLERPLIIAGTTIAYADLRLDPRIHPEFLRLIARAYIKLTRPFVEYKDEGLIHYFLDSLSQNPT